MVGLICGAAASTEPAHFGRPGFSRSDTNVFPDMTRVPGIVLILIIVWIFRAARHSEDSQERNLLSTASPAR